jgi:hypothetical protein
MTRLNSCAALAAVFALAALTACAPPANETSETAAPPAIDPVIEAVVLATRPDVIITGGELDAEDGEYEVSGTLPNGEEIEFDLMQADGVWRVTQIQRDVPWETAPEPVRAAFDGSPRAFAPVRVIESTDPVDGTIYYQLFSADDRPGHPSEQVRWLEGEAAVMPRAH